MIQSTETMPMATKDWAMVAMSFFSPTNPL